MHWSSECMDIILIENGETSCYIWYLFIHFYEVTLDKNDKILFNTILYMIW